MTADARPHSERPRPSGVPVLRADERFLEQLAAALADRLAGRLQDRGPDDDRYLNAEAAGRYIGATRKRIHDLTSGGQLAPDGHDGRRPLYRRRTLDAYVQQAAIQP